MRTLRVEIADVLVHDATQVLLAENEYVIKAFTANAADESLAEGVRTRRTNRRAEDFNLGRDVRKVFPVFPVIIADQILWAHAKRCCFAPLLRDPGIRGCPRHVHSSHA